MSWWVKGRRAVSYTHLSSEALLKEMLGPGLINPYGLSETSTVAVRLPGEEFFRVNSDTHVVNILDDDGNPADNGVAVVTPLYKTDFPLINYVTGDRMESRMVDGLRQITNIKGCLLYTSRCV